MTTRAKRKLRMGALEKRSARHIKRCKRYLLIVVSEQIITVERNLEAVSHSLGTTTCCPANDRWNETSRHGV